MHAIWLPYLLIFRGCIILRHIHLFLVFTFLLIIIRKLSQLYLYRQMRRDYKINFTNKLKANLWIHFNLAKVHCLKWLTSLYIAYLNFLNLNNIMTLPKLLLSLKLGYDATYVCLVLFFACQI